MPVKATLELGKREILFGESPPCVLKIDNATRDSLRDFNVANAKCLPTIVVTDLRGGDQFRHARPRSPGEGDPSEILPAGKGLNWELPLGDLCSFPAPGQYQIEALHAWNNGRPGLASTPPVTVNVLPAYPRSLSVEPVLGGTSGNCLAAWVHCADAMKEQYEIWLSTISLARRPRMTDCVRLGGVKRPVKPVLSVPPNKHAQVQWIAWLDDGNVNYVPHSFGSVVDVASTPAPGPNCQIIAPLLIHALRPAEQLPGAAALLFESAEDAPGGRLVLSLLQLRAKGPVEQIAVVPTPDLNPVWARNAFLSDLRRLTFFLTAVEPGQCVLRLSTWSMTRPPGVPVEMARWDGRYVAGHTLVTRDDAVRGVMLAEVNATGIGRYALCQWVYWGQGKFAAADPIPVAWPKTDPIEQAVVRINEFGAGFALLRAADKQRTWYFCRYDGTVVPVAEEIRPPVDILFRYGDDPTMLFTEPGRGFQFERP